ncbi:MAG: YqgE/AlgH family protein [Pusillimonas sp.]|nr:YqgE/AlgH family protein [Pusillimonas sp.]
MASIQFNNELSVDLSKQFLLAMPGMDMGEWAHSVVFVCEHNTEGALGLIVNRPSDITVANMLERLGLELDNAAQAAGDQVVYFGGPVHTDRGFVLHSTVNKTYASTINLGNFQLTTSRDVLEDIAKGEGPEQFLVTLGYAGWGTGQLESELAQNAWLNVEATPSVIFDLPHDGRYEAALGALGINSSMLTGVAGHA